MILAMNLPFLASDMTKKDVRGRQITISVSMDIPENPSMNPFPSLLFHYIIQNINHYLPKKKSTPKSKF